LKLEPSDSTLQKIIAKHTAENRFSTVWIPLPKRSGICTFWRIERLFMDGGGGSLRLKTAVFSEKTPEFVHDYLRAADQLEYKFWAPWSVARQALGLAHSTWFRPLNACTMQRGDQHPRVKERLPGVSKAKEEAEAWFAFLDEGAGEEARFLKRNSEQDQNRCSAPSHAPALCRFLEAIAKSSNAVLDEKLPFYIQYGYVRTTWSCPRRAPHPGAASAAASHAFKCSVHTLSG
jgi:hypothetical protein